MATKVSSQIASHDDGRGFNGASSLKYFSSLKLHCLESPTKILISWHCKPNSLQRAESCPFLSRNLLSLSIRPASKKVISFSCLWAECKRNERDLCFFSPLKVVIGLKERVFDVISRCLLMTDIIVVLIVPISLSSHNWSWERDKQTRFVILNFFLLFCVERRMIDFCFSPQIGLVVVVGFDLGKVGRWIQSNPDDPPFTLCPRFHCRYYKWVRFAKGLVSNLWTCPFYVVYPEHVWSRQGGTDHLHEPVVPPWQLWND